MKMKVAEVREIKEKMSLETVGITGRELSAFFSQGANEIQKMVKLRRKQKMVPKTAIDYAKTVEHSNQTSLN
jgi:DNA topoisomerase VI subunit B